MRAIAFIVAAVFLLAYGVSRSSPAIVVLGMLSAQLGAIFLSLAVIPILPPFWGMAAILGPFSGLAFSFAAFGLGVWAVFFSPGVDAPLVRTFGYLFLLLGALSVANLIKRLISRRSRYDLDAEYLHLLGVAHFRKGQYEQAIQKYTMAIEHEPTGEVVFWERGQKLAIAYSNRSHANLAAGSYDAAIADAEAALRVDPNDEHAKHLRAEARIRGALGIDPPRGDETSIFAAASRTGARDAVRGRGPFGRDRVPALVALMEDRDERVRWVVNEILRDMGPNALDAVPGLLRALKDPHGYVRGSAVVALGEIKQTTPEVVAGLAEALRDSDSFVRGVAADALGKLGPVARSAVESLEKLQARDPDNRVRQLARKAVARISAG